MSANVPSNASEIYYTMTHPRSHRTAPRLPREVNVTEEVYWTVENKAAREFVVLN